MQIRVLGSAAGGGFPQWNCACPNCSGLRRGELVASARTQESVALSSDAESWFVLNASPEIRQQIESFAPLAPRVGRGTPIAGIVLTNGDLDHCLGLLSLRESEPLVVWATDRVRDGFTRNNALYRTLERFEGHVTWRCLELGSEMPLLLGNGVPSGLSIEALALPGKPPLHLMPIEHDPADNIGLRIRELATGRAVAYAPGVAKNDARVAELLGGVDAAFFDGTFWSEDELSSVGVGSKRAAEMGHWPVGGAGGSLEMLGALPVAHKILIHVNNTNPLLRDDSRERALATRAGVAVAHDGMGLEL